MFEQTLGEMEATIYIEPKFHNDVTASNLPFGDFEIAAGENRVGFDYALWMVGEIDSRMVSCPKYMQKRVRSFRNQVVSAFGPDLAEIVGWAS